MRLWSRAFGARRWRPLFALFALIARLESGRVGRRAGRDLACRKPWAIHRVWRGHAGPAILREEPSSFGLLNCGGSGFLVVENAQKLHWWRPAFDLRPFCLGRRRLAALRRHRRDDCSPLPIALAPRHPSVPRRRAAFGVAGLPTTAAGLEATGLCSSRPTSGRRPAGDDVRVASEQAGHAALSQDPCGLGEQTRKQPGHVLVLSRVDAHGEWQIADERIDALGAER
mmetsp:Transcript_65820/g.148507  ORF Transcript_65820/g.148507 Transcript_65820/m.148507 type:complete len:227 (-) Transcript_65820:1223-1903(-)